MTEQEATDRALLILELVNANIITRTEARQALKCMVHFNGLFKKE